MRLDALCYQGHTAYPQDGCLLLSSPNVELRGGDLGPEGVGYVLVALDVQPYGLHLLLQPEGGYSARHAASTMQGCSSGTAHQAHKRCTLALSRLACAQRRGTVPLEPACAAAAAAAISRMRVPAHPEFCFCRGHVMHGTLGLLQCLMQALQALLQAAYLCAQVCLCCLQCAWSQCTWLGDKGDRDLRSDVLHRLHCPHRRSGIG